MSGNEDLATLLFEHGPLASVYLDTTSATNTPRELIDLRWKNARRQFEGGGADTATLDAMEATVAGCGAMISTSSDRHRAAGRSAGSKRGQRTCGSPTPAKSPDGLAKRFDEASARLVVLSGDVRAVQFLKESLPGRVLDVLEEVDGGREEEASGRIAEEAVRLVANAVASDTVALLAKFREERGQDDRASDGVPVTVAALQRGQVETLLVHDDPTDDRCLWFGPEGVHLATAAERLAELGVTSPREGRLPDVLIRAALATGSEVRIVPTMAGNGPTDNVGAILRWAS